MGAKAETLECDRTRLSNLYSTEISWIHQDSVFALSPLVMQASLLLHLYSDIIAFQFMSLYKSIIMMPKANNCGSLVTANPYPREHTDMLPHAPAMCRTLEHRQALEPGEVLTKLLILSQVL